MANAVKRGWQEVSLVAYSITLSGQDITSHVDQMSIKIEDALGQGAGAGSSGATQGRAATFTFNTDLGPMNNAVGAGASGFRPQPPQPVRQGGGILTDATRKHLTCGGGPPKNQKPHQHQTDARDKA